jgi:hypothetical protein
MKGASLKNFGQCALQARVLVIWRAKVDESMDVRLWVEVEQVDPLNVISHRRGTIAGRRKDNGNRNAGYRGGESTAVDCLV